LISTALTAGLVDAAIIACDGAGTVVTADPRMVQGIGGRMSGLVQTSPIPEVIGRILDGGGIVPDPDHASIDPVCGIRAAKAAGFGRLAVTVAGSLVAKKVREEDSEAIIIVVHTTGTSPGDAEILASTGDIITACASGSVRSICGEKALIQAGKSVPVFGLTKNGKELIVERIRAITDPLVVMSARLPVRGESEPEPLV
jgi:putative methanogenesis marker protein 8